MSETEARLSAPCAKQAAATCEMTVEKPLNSPRASRNIAVSLLTGGGDKPYALGIALALSACGIHIDFIGSNDLDVPELRCIETLNFLNLRGDSRAGVSRLKKVIRVFAYYVRLVCYAANARPKIFHILWNNKFESFDRTVLMAYYRLIGKRIVLTAHNVNAGKRDSKDDYLNRLTLRIQYWFADHIFVHTQKMKQELTTTFDVPTERVTVVPFGINNTLPNTGLTTFEAKRKFDIGPSHKSILFFGNIAPYKGLEDLVTAFGSLAAQDPDYRLIIAGRVKDCDEYWQMIQQAIARDHLQGSIIRRIEYIPDERVEEFFKAADVFVLPYRHIFQSGVLFLGYSFGLPVIVSDVGSMTEDVIEGRTGLVCRPSDPVSLAAAIRKYFESNLFEHLEDLRSDIREVANNRYSWHKVAEITKEVYGELLES